MLNQVQKLSEHHITQRCDASVKQNRAVELWNNWATTEGWRADKQTHRWTDGDTSVISQRRSRDASVSLCNKTHKEPKEGARGVQPLEHCSSSGCSSTVSRRGVKVAAWLTDTARSSSLANPALSHLQPEVAASCALAAASLVVFDRLTTHT